MYDSRYKTFCTAIKRRLSNVSLLKLPVINCPSEKVIVYRVSCIIPILALLFSSCNINRFLSNDQYIINANKITITKTKTKKQRQTLEKDLPLLYRQKELPVFLFGHSTINTWHYFKAQEQAEKKAKTKWLNRALAKTPSFYDKTLTDLTVQNMKKSLKNAGYWYNTVYFEKDFHGKDKGLADITYIVNPGTQYVYDSVRLMCADSAYQKILDSTRNESFLYRGQPMSVGVYEAEKARLARLFSNLGYARFNPNYIQPLDGDTTIIAFDSIGNRLVNATLSIQLPNDKSLTQQFVNGQVTVFPNYDARQGERYDSVAIIKNKVLFTDDGKIGLNANTFARILPIQPFGMYRQKTGEEIFKKISSLGLYKFINIKPLIDECDSNSISYKIYLTPNKKMVADVGAEIYYGNVANTKLFGNSLRLGVSGSLNLTHRNLFGGAERYTLSLSGGVDFGLQSTDSIQNGKSTDWKIENRLLIPKFINLSKSWKLYRDAGIIRKSFYQDIKENGQTEINLSYILSDRIPLNLYSLAQFNAGFRYLLNRNNANNERFTIAPTAVELNLGTVTDSFRNKNEQNQRLLHSFDSTIVTGLVFRSFSHEYSAQNSRWRFIYNIQQSGTELWVIDKILNRKEPLRLFPSLGFAKFWRIDGEARYNVPLNDHISYALRVSAGVASSFADAVAVPYSYQFYVGGPNSIRAWQQRAVGPGGYSSSVNTTLPSQTGEIKFDFNSELRFDLFWRIKSALFLDAGNVWNLRKDENIPDGEFTKFWYDQLAIGTGLGLRLDLSYFLLRLDFGWKLRNPYGTNGNYWIPFNEYTLKNNSNWNFAIGLPF